MTALRTRLDNGVSKPVLAKPRFGTREPQVIKPLTWGYSSRLSESNR